MMPMSSGPSTPSGSGGLWYAAFGLNVYLQEYKDYPGKDCLRVMPSNGDAETVYVARNSFDRDTTLGA